jgi:rhamnosyltransferase
MSRIGLLIPTLNAGLLWDQVLNSVKIQTLHIDRKIIVDSGSNDETLTKAIENGFEVLQIEKKNFDHGYARQLLADAANDCDILIYLTQDCILNGGNSLVSLVESFNNDQVGLAYGRQLPHRGAKVLETHARLFNYPKESVIKKYSDKATFGIKTASCSNSFAAYRVTALTEVGGFPSHTILGEDVIVGGRMLVKGWNIAYVGSAEGFHSHDYTAKEEFKRYFDIGVFHKTHHWLIDEFGTAGGEGLRYLKSEFFYVIKHNLLIIPKMIATIGAKFIGYKLGMKFENLSIEKRKKFSMHKRYWNKV